MPRFAGRVYEGKGNNFLAIYNHYSDIHVLAPPSIREVAKRVAHSEYSNGGKRSGIDIFEIPFKPDLSYSKTIKGASTFVSRQIPEVFFFNPIRSVSDVHRVDQLQDVSYDVVQGTDPRVLDLVREDIKRFCNQPAKHSINSGISYVQQIEPITQIRRISYGERGMLETGKQESVDQCVFAANLDFAKGCVTGWVPRGHSNFDGDTFRGFFLDPFSECIDCYAMPNHQTFVKNVYKQIDSKQLKAELLGGAHLTFGSEEQYGRKVEVLRFAKRTEAGSKFTLENLVAALEVCADVGVKTVMPTKFLEFNPQIADLERRTNSTLLFSLSWDRECAGACAYGCDNAFRMEQALKYKEAGVNTALYLLIHAPFPPTHREKSILEFAKQHNMQVQLLPKRFTSKDSMLRATGYHWDFLREDKTQQKEAFSNFPGQEFMGTYSVSSGVASPEVINQEWLKILENNNGEIRMCHHNKKNLWCGSCFTKRGIYGTMKHKERKRIPKTKRGKEDLPLFSDE